MSDVPSASGSASGSGSLPDREHIAQRTASRLVTKGAHCVVLVGSVARGAIHEGSDIDLIAIGAGPELVLEAVDDVLVSVSWTTTSGVRDAFDDPETAGAAVCAWRGARLLADPNGIGASLQHHAHGWSWDGIHIQAERAVANELTLLAEDVNRIVGLRLAGRLRAAAPIRWALIWPLVRSMAIHHRLFYESENDLWDLVASVMGPDWERDFDIAVGVERGAADLGALSMYRQAVARGDRVLSSPQRAVVAAALRMIDRAISWKIL